MILTQTDRPDRQFALSLKRALRGSLAAFCLLIIYASSSSVFASSSVTPVRYPFCSKICPNCCLTPDRELQQQFRGNPPTGKSLNDRYLDNLWPLIESKIVAVTNEINKAVVRQTSSRGSFIDAQNNNKTASSLQSAGASTAGSYINSEALCRFATLSQGLASSEAKTDFIKFSAAKQSMDRQLLTSGMPSSANTAKSKDGKEGVSRGQSADKQARWEKYVTTFCDPDDYGQGSGSSGVCQTSSYIQYNKDINFADSFGDPLTLDIVSSGTTKDAESIEALSNNLYAHDLVNNLPQVTSGSETDGMSAEMRKYMLLRSVIAKRAIAENSFSSITALKAKGSPSSAKFTQNLMRELGISEDQAKRFVGDNPSYYAQMEALTRKLYETPVFYANLMDNPKNVLRQQNAMKSLELMQQRDMYKSIQRSEMLMATLLEIYLSRSQGGLDKQLVQSQ